MSFLSKIGLGFVEDAFKWVLGIEEQEQQTGTQVNKQSNIAPIPVIYGERKVGGTRVFVSTGGGTNNEYLYIALALAEGEVDSIGDVYINDVLSTDAKFSGKITIQKYTGTDDQTATTLFNDADTSWTSAHRLRGVAYLAMRFKYDSDTFSGIPEIKAVVRGRKVYDPRQDSTSAYYDANVGVSTQRQADQSTWKYSSNNAICLRDFLTNERFGKGLPTSAIDDETFTQAADDCDEIVTSYTSGPDISLFSCNGVFDTSQTVFDNVKRFLANMRGIMSYSYGQYNLKIDKPQSSTFDLTPNNILSDIKIASASKNKKYNKVTTKFVNPDANWQDDTAIWPPAGSAEETTFLSADNNQELATEVTLHNTTNFYAARDLARIICLGSRDASLQIELTATSDAFAIAPGDVVTIEHPSLGWTDSAKKLARVTSIRLNENGEADLRLQEYSPSIYIWDESSEQPSTPASTLPDPFVIAPPTNLSATASTQQGDDGTTLSYIDVSWTAANDAFVERYELTYTPAGENPQTVLVTGTNYQLLILNTNVTYAFSVKSINALGVKSTAVTTTGVSAVIDTIAPGEPSAPSVIGTFKQIDLAWTNPTDNDFKYIEIKRAGTTVEADAVVIGTTAGNSYIDANYTGVVTRYYWLRAVDYSGNASAWVSAGGGTTQHLVTDDFDDGVITIDFLDSATQTTINNAVQIADYDIDLTQINNDISEINTDITGIEADVQLRALDSDFQNVTQNLDNNLTTASERLLSMSLFASEQAQIMRDAGVTVDPDNGSVTIQAVEQLRTETDTQFTQVGIEIDAQTAEIELRATRTFVENEIAAAQLDPTDFTAFTDLQARVNQAEIDIDANTASVVLKADQTEIDNLDLRVSQAEIDIDANSASIALKASQSDFDDLGTRITTAEIQLDAIDAPSITQTVIDVNNLTHRVNEAEAQDLKQLLEIYDTRQVLQQDISFARTQITADTLETRESIATARTELLARIDTNQASIISEAQTRADQDNAIASDVTQLQTDLNIAETGISGNATAITSLDSRVTVSEGEITSISSDVTSLQTSVVNAENDISGNATAISGLDTRVTSAEGSISTQSTSITNLESSVGGLETDVSGNATAITNLGTRVTSAEGTISTQSTDIVNLKSDVTDLETDTSANATAISGLDTRVTSAEGAISTQSTSITNLQTGIATKVSTYSQDEEPTSDLVNGDLWIDTDDNNKLYRYNNETWVEAADSRISDTATALNTLTTTVTQNGTDITAVAQDLTNLTTEVNENTAEITSVAETASSETRASAKRLETLVSGQAVTQLTEILNREDNQELLTGELAIVRSDFNAVTIANSEAIAQSRIDLTALINGNSADITAEQIARASADEVLASDINALRADLTSAETDISGNATATTLLTARVTDNEGEITSISADVTTLQSSLLDAQNDISANATANAALDTRVIATESSIVSQSSDIVALQSSVVDIETDTVTNATAITNLDTRVTSTEGTITSQSTSITDLQSSLGDVETAAATNATAVTNLDTRVTSAEGTITSQSTSITELTTAVGDNTTAITNEQTARATEDTALANSISTLATTVGGHTTEIATNTTSIDGVTAQYSVTINNNGTVSGFGLVSDIIDGNPTSAFNLSADQFSITNSTQGVLWDSETTYVIGDVVNYLGRQYVAKFNNTNVTPPNVNIWDDATTVPFVVYTSNQSVTKNETSYTIPAGTYIADAFIQTAAIGTAEIQTAAITNAKIDDLAVTNAKIDNLAVTAGKIANLAVDTIKIADQAVTIPSSSFLASEVDVASAITDLQSVTFTSTGAPVSISFSAKVKSMNIGFGNNAEGTLYVYRGTTLLYTYDAIIDMPYNQTTAIAFTVSDTPPSAGEVTYTVKASASSTTTGHKYSLRSLNALEVKK